jgi:chemotaxis methyl-accepting protein methylase/chemotaxis signal transduction protein
METDDVMAYLSTIKSSVVKTRELIEMVVVNETWFFRQPEAFTWLSSVVNSKRRQLTMRNRLRILCLGCSTGEEPYSVAMLMQDMGIEPRLFMIDAVDISENALEKAKSAIYGASSFDDKNDLSFRQNHFIKANKGFELRKEVKDCVNFIHGNILHHTCPLSSPEYDIIFCRHVTIYLCDGARATLLKRLNKLLASDGTIFIGASETSILRNNGYTACKAPSAFAFERTVTVEEETPEPKVAAPAPDRTTKARPSAMTTISKVWVEKEEIIEDEPETIPEYCWLINGISGDRSCEKLDQYIRCYNCPVRIDHGRQFLDRESPKDYLDDWKENLAQKEKKQNASQKEHTVIFRLGNELFGIPSLPVKDISRMVDIHSIPYRSNKILLGMANFSGDLRLCVSLSALLNVAETKDENGRTYKRMVTLEAKGEDWSFPVDEIVEIQNIFESDVTPPSSQDGTGATYSLGTATVNEKSIRLLDHQLLLESLRRGIQ